MAIVLPAADTPALAAAALDGDEEALGRLLATHQRTAYNLAYRLLGREADARDAVQEAFLLAVRAVRGDGAPPRQSDRFEPWLRRVVANVALGQLRRRPSFRPVPIDEVAEALPASGLGDPEREAERRETRGDVLRALLALPDAQRAALTLREYQGLSYEEIAAMLGVSRGAVETLLFRARRGFRDAYEGLMATSGPIGCPDLAPLLSAMIDDELDAAAWPKLSAHAGQCPRCRRELGGLRRVRRLHALIPLLAAPAAWHCTATASAAGLATAAGVVAAAPAAPAPIAAGGGLVAKLASLAGVKATGAMVAAGLGAAVIATPVLEHDPADLARAISARVVVAPSVHADGQASTESTASAPGSAIEGSAGEAPAESPTTAGGSARGGTSAGAVTASHTSPADRRLAVSGVAADSIDRASGSRCHPAVAPCGPTSPVAALAPTIVAAMVPADAPDRARGHGRHPDRPTVMAMVPADAAERSNGGRRDLTPSAQNGAAHGTVGRPEPAPGEDETEQHWPERQPPEGRPPERHVPQAEHHPAERPEGAATGRVEPPPLVDRPRPERAHQSPQAVPPGAAPPNAAPPAAAPPRQSAPPAIDRPATQGSGPKPMEPQRARDTGGTAPSSPPRTQAAGAPGGQAPAARGAPGREANTAVAKPQPRAASPQEPKAPAPGRKP